MPAEPLPSKIGVVIFPGFQLLDYAGPLDALDILSNDHTLILHTIAATLDPVSTQNFGQDERDTFDTAPSDLDVLILPGGLGARGPGSDERMKPQIEYLKSLDLSGNGSIKWVLTVCTGSEILARTGVLDGRRATTNKRAFNHVKAKHPNVNWVAKARWVADGNVWTSSGISAGIDVTFAWIAEVFGKEAAEFVADRSEYERNIDAENDRFAARWGAV